MSKLAALLSSVLVWSVAGETTRKWLGVCPVLLESTGVSTHMLLYRIVLRRLGAAVQLQLVILSMMYLIQVRTSQ